MDVKLLNIYRPKEYLVFLETHFRDAVLDYESDPDVIQKLLKQDKWEQRRITRRGKDAIAPHITEKEKANVGVVWNFNPK